ncbi:hypothetical protein I2492_06010 [Budviciaceae bacterium CWB-B4]|uniref:Uncharacterized protein n=1 Tax=Limnobaculum xujianqingii TaxID=2738837 RepID=A0A9D7AH73_9GAMM|nr:hypothetical protein [Limnobaculum xujianqingii]MBK5072563.1 hypothetical protein [Limnobaculum xujianqingii]MBK5175872.1 hypothetical protein [Limnobaculum xujianqingii]
MTTQNRFVAEMEQRQDLVNKVIDILHKELTDAEMEKLIYGQELWMAMQIICGPVGAAKAVTYSSVNCCFKRS